jgi:hypothetical protein
VAREEKRRALLIGHAFDDELQRIRRRGASCINRLLARRIQISLRFLDAIECEYNQALRRISINFDEFLAADDIMTAGSRKLCCRVRPIYNGGL